jgi:hypothetical protein
MDDLVPESSNKFFCFICNYNTSRNSQYNRHLLTAKHKKSTIFNNFQQKSSIFTCECGKIYKERTGLYRHKKKCDYKQEFSNEIINKEEKSILLDKEGLIIELLKQNKELLEIVKNGTSQIVNNNTMTNCNNKTFNLQVFLNETCKNAMNLSEFIENMTVELPDLENMGKLGYVEGVTNIIIKNLKALEITQRPIHCTDEKRETVMIKDNNVWFKEGDDRENLRKIISSVISKNIILLAEYQEKYPDCNTYDSHRSDEYTKIIMETATNQGEKKKEKIFRLIAREVAINKSIL